MDLAYLEKINVNSKLEEDSGEYKRKHVKANEKEKIVDKWRDIIGCNCQEVEVITANVSCKRKIISMNWCWNSPIKLLLPP